jgi:NADH-quinone oxidoreductase subunit G
VQAGAADTVIILENDLYRRLRRDLVDDFLSLCPHVIALDCLENATTAKAELVLPAATFAEGDGTLVSSEGRAQRFFQVFDRGSDADIQESWRWLRDAGAGRPEAAEWQNLDDVMAALASSLPALARITQAAPHSDFRIGGEKIPREPHRYSGRTAMYADISVHEPKPPDDPDSPLSFSMEGYPGEPPGAVIPFFWAPRWNSIQAVNKFQREIAGELRGGDPGVRLIEPATEAVASHVSAIPPAFKPRIEEWLIVPLFHLFGSEELSMAAPAIEELAAKPYMMLRPDDAHRIGVEAGEDVELSLSGWTLRLTVKLESGLPRGIAGLPIGLPGIGSVTLPAWGRILRLPAHTI